MYKFYLKYLDQKRHEEALMAWENAVKQRPSHTAAWSNILVLLDTMEKYNKAVETGMKALLHNPLSPVLHFTMGNVLGKVRQFATAEKHFLEAIRLNSTNALYYSNLGELRIYVELLRFRWFQEFCIIVGVNRRKRAKNI